MRSDVKAQTVEHQEVYALITLQKSSLNFFIITDECAFQFPPKLAKKKDCGCFPCRPVAIYETELFTPSIGTKLDCLVTVSKKIVCATSTQKN